MTGDPLAIYRAELDRMTPLLLAGAVEDCLPLISVPLVSHTLDGTLVCTARDDVRRLLADMAARLAQLGADELVRVAETARWLGPHEIAGFHVTEARRRGVTVLPPYASRQVIRRQGDGPWRLIEADAIVRRAAVALADGPSDGRSAALPTAAPTAPRPAAPFPETDSKGPRA
jgi:hypothetical protein